MKPWHGGSSSRKPRSNATGTLLLGENLVFPCRQRPTIYRMIPLRLNSSLLPSISAPFLIAVVQQSSCAVSACRAALFRLGIQPPCCAKLQAAEQ